jgi:glycine cleavage system H protein
MNKVGKYEINDQFFYDRDTHFWVDLSEKGVARIGMSPLVQETSGSFVAVVVDDQKAIKQGESFGSIEAEKHVGPLISPVSGELLEVNQAVIENPRLINTDPYGVGWLIKLALTDQEEEMKRLISGGKNITDWFVAELKRFEEKGWIAQ